MKGELTPTPTIVERTSRLLGAMRWSFLPFGLFALVAVGVHAGADVFDDWVAAALARALAGLSGAVGDGGVLARWLAAFGPREQTLCARAVALLLELSVDALVAFPLLAYAGAGQGLVRDEAWRARWRRLLRRPTPMRYARPALTAIFAFGGAHAVSRLAEATLFVGLVGDVASPEVAQVLARVGGAVALACVLFSLGWRAVVGALAHADDCCEGAAQRSWAMAWRAGAWGTLLALPLAVALLSQARALLALVS